MILSQISTFQPSKNAYFLNTQYPNVQTHPSGDFMAFTTRAHELILYNKKTGRTASLFKSEHGIIDVKFTTDLLIAVQKGHHQILCFSLKTQKLKKKITGNRSEITKLAYCRQRGLFACITHDVCTIYNEVTLSKQKLLKCSTSSFNDLQFIPSGQYLFTVFKDSTFFVWDLQNYNYTQYSLQGKNLRVASNYSSYVSLYNQKNVYIADLSKQALIFQKIDQFWDHKIKKAEFIENVLIIQTQKMFYIAQICYQHKFVSRSIKAIEEEITTFNVGGYGSVIVMLSNQAKKISCFHILDQNKKVIGIPKNPLQNMGLNCCGGYSNQKGCFIAQSNKTTQVYGKSGHQIEPIYGLTYHQSTASMFSVQKFQDFVKKHHIFPDKHRSSAYKFLLNLSICPEQFQVIQRKGWHQAVEILDAKYPLQNKKISDAMKNIISWLANVDPIYGEAENVPSIVFAFVCLFGQDEYLCFDIVYRLFTHWLSFLFDEFPVANSSFLQNVYEILEIIDPQLINFMKQTRLSFTKLSWGLVSNLFTTNLPKQAFLALIDNLFVNPNNPQLIMFMLIGYIVYNKPRIMSLKSQKDLQKFLDQEHTVNTGKFLNHVFKYQQQFSDKVIYKFRQTDFYQAKYKQMNSYPKQAVAMFRNRRKLQTEQLKKNNSQKVYKEMLVGEMQKLTIQAKRNSQKQMIRAQSYNYHCQNQSKNPSTWHQSRKTDIRQERIHRLQKLIDQLTQAMRNSQIAKKTLSQSRLPIPKSFALYDRSDNELSDLQADLMQKLSRIRPANFVKPLTSVPLSIPRGNGNQNLYESDYRSQQNFRSAINSKVANKMWNLDKLQNQNQGLWFQNDLLRSMKV